MPFTPQQSIIAVEPDNLHAIDTSSVENLFGIWSILSKTSHAIKDGKRLENLSWRLWNRETFCCNRKESRSSQQLCAHATRPRVGAVEEKMPELSSSLESASSEEFEEATALRSASIPKARPELVKMDQSQSCADHLTPLDLQKLVNSIQATPDVKQPIEIEVPMPASLPLRLRTQERETASAPSDVRQSPLTAIAQPSPAHAKHDSAIHPPPSITASQSTLLESSASTVDTNDDDGSQAVGSQHSSNTEVSTNMDQEEQHSIVRGFNVGGAPSSYRSQTNLAAQPTPILKRSPPAHPVPKKRGAMFTIGTSSGEDESSLESHMYRSSLSASLRRPNSNVSGGSSKKTTSFKEEVAIGRAAEHSPVFDESDEEDEDVSESAIEEDDDDSDEWEDSDEPSGQNSVNEKEYFQRVDSRPNLTSRRSMLTTMMHEPDRARALQNAASRSTPAMRRSRTSTPNGPSVATSPEPTARMPPNMMPPPAQQDQSQPTRPRAIQTTTNTTQSLSLSPRTTRRNMLSTELTESLRKNLLWERQHRSNGNLAALKRRHTSNDVKNLRQHPEPAPVLSHQDGGKRFSNDYFNAGLGEYHAKGW